MSLSKFCPIGRCQRRILSGYLVCPEHWQLLPSSSREKLWDLARQAGAGSPAYKAAVKAALIEIEKRQALDTPAPAIEA